MRWLPVQSKIIVSPLQAYEVIQLLQKATSPPSLDKKDHSNQTIFVGIIDQNTFRISMKLKVPENFSPIIYGKVDNTSIGSIISIEFSLFFSSQMFLIFWSTICAAASLLFIFLFNESVYALISLSVGLINYTVAILNFNKKIDECHQSLLNVLKMDK